MQPHPVSPSIRRPDASRPITLMALAGLAICCPALGADDGTFSKTITWTAKKPDVNATGTFTGGPVSAAASHSAGHGFEACALQMSQPAASSNWNLITGLPAVPSVQTGLQDCQGGVAEASMSCTVGVWTATANGEGTLTTKLDGKAYARVFHSPPDNQAATADAKGKVEVEGFLGEYPLPADRKGKVKNKAAGKSPDITGSNDGKKAASWKDPVVLELRLSDSTLVAAQTLMTLDARAVGDASALIDDTELVLKCAADGYSRVTIESALPGSWITASTGAFSIGLRDGLFTGSPAVLGLPWACTFSAGRIVEARLPAALLPAFECEYEIPAYLFQPGVQYRQVLRYDEEVAAAASGGGGDLWNNGPITTDASALCIPFGAAASRSAGPVVGTGNQILEGNRIADDFLVRAPGGWEIREVEFLAYQPGALPEFCPINQVNLRIWSGRPGEPGSFVVFGDPFTNRMISAEYAGVYRMPDTLCWGDRPVFKIRAAVNIDLPQGAYWLDWQMGGLLESGPFVPAVTFASLGADPAGNALWSGASGAYLPVLDPLPNGPAAQDFPFIVRGRRIGTCYANCDNSTASPVLNVLDFACFLNKFASGDIYANCDNSTTPPALNVLDFACFLNRFAVGCP